MLLPSFLNTRSSADITTAAFASSALVVSVRMRRRVMGFLTAVGMAAVVVLGTAVPASATVGNMFTVDYITYIVTSEDPATVVAADYDTAGGAIVVIPSSVENGTIYTVTSIGDNAFEGDRFTVNGFALTSVTIPDSVISIGVGAFVKNSLRSVTIPDSVTSIGDQAFIQNSLESVTIGDSVTHIGVQAFVANLLESVTIPNSVLSIGDGAFFSNLLGSVTIGDSVTTIGNQAFRTNLLESVTIPNSVVSIGVGAFFDNLLTSVTIPDLVTYIGDGAFENNLLESVTFSGPAPSLDGTNALGDPAVVRVYYHAEYGANVVTDGFTTPTWEGYTTSIVVAVSLDLGLNVGDAVADAPVEVTAEGLLADSEYTVVVRSIPITIGSGSATNTGTVSGVIGQMPSGLTAGPHTVTFTGTDANGIAITRVAYLTVSDTGTVTYLSYTAAESLTLAETGFEAAPFGAAALLLLVAGVALMVRRRRVTA
jgi:hypothetical protein